jgi:23S rRNA (cytosine1962-C5)-methyltransferase
MPDGPDYALLDVGGAARLERFGPYVVDRPAPGALGERRDPAAWRAAGLRFERDRGWLGPAAGSDPWPIVVDGLTVELRPTEAGQLGLFPEHAAMLPWLRDQAAAATVLNLFAYTGLGTLAMADADASVTHVDAARTAVAWARRNAELSGLTDRPVRWIVDDALTFVEREARRGRRYDGVVLDPPSYGHAGANRTWRFEEDLPALLDRLRRVLEPGAFALLTAHTPGFDGERLGELLTSGLRRHVARPDVGELVLDTDDGRQLPLGSFARIGLEAS